MTDEKPMYQPQSRESREEVQRHQDRQDMHDTIAILWVAAIAIGAVLVVVRALVLNL